VRSITKGTMKGGAFVDENRDSRPAHRVLVWGGLLLLAVTPLSGL
jgi:hypothetical protein